MDNEAVLCICISTYNRAEKIDNMVREILTCRSDKLKVVVVDDNSTDDTVKRLNNISDQRLCVYKNAFNLGAKGNWYETIDKGRGKYLLHFLDRDYLNYLYLEKLIELLENETCGFGYIGNIFSMAPSKKKEDRITERYHKGSEALSMFACTLVHPSGAILKRESWNKLRGKKRIFESYDYGIYPHSYIFAMLAQREDGIRINYKMISISDVDHLGKYQSRFYERSKEKLKYWWTPEAHQWEMNCLTDFLCDQKAIRIPVLRSILSYRFAENLSGATLIYQELSRDTENIRHYRMKKKFVTGIELLKINIKFIRNYMIFLLKDGFSIWKMQLIVIIIKEGIANAKDIIEYK